MTQPTLKTNFDGFNSGTQALSPDRRADTRFITVYRLVKVEHAGDEGLGRCRNLSDGGAKLELHMDLALDDHVTVTFSPAEVVSGRVIWTEGHHYGIAFDHPVDCMSILGSAAQHDGPAPPRPPRLKTNLPARIACQGDTSPSVVADISVRGMKIASVGSFEPGLRVRVILDGGRECEGVVRWSRDNVAGIMLLDPFRVEDLGSVRRLSLAGLNDPTAS